MKVNPRVLAPSGAAVQIVILSRDRRDFCRQTIQSVLNQDYDGYELVVSDNSTTTAVVEMLETEFPQIKVIRRIPALSAEEHYNCVLSEADKSFLVMFHDDDIMESNYVTKMMSLMTDYPQAIAAGCNANVILGVRQTKEGIMRAFKGTRLLASPQELVRTYMSLGDIGAAPFPGYMYRTAAIKGKAINWNEGGKHADVSFLCKLVTVAPIVWTDRRLISYRVHAGSDSGTECIGDRLSLVRFAVRHGIVVPKSTLHMDFRFIYWRRWVKQVTRQVVAHQAGGGATGWRLAVVRRFLFTSKLRLAVTRVEFWFRLFRVLSRWAKT